MTINNQNIPNLEELGWDAFFNEAFQKLASEGLLPARVIGQERTRYKVAHAGGESFAVLSGRAAYREIPGEVRPTVGDWVAIRSVNTGSDALIEAVLPRKSKLSRQVAGGRNRFAGGITNEQVVAANVDVVFIVGSLDNERNASLRRIERYLALVWSAGAAPVVILNKVDLCEDIPARLAAVEQVAAGAPVLPLSATRKLGLEALRVYLEKGKTAVFLGLSGVGKSSLINSLLGDARIKVGEVRESDARGRHTTTRRELFLLPEGGMVIDTPGMREIQVWGDDEDVYGAFQDIAALAEQCRFRDCTHREEPGCAVTGAIAAGALDAHRLSNYHKLQRETRYLNVRQENKASLVEKQKWKQISKIQKQYQKNNPG
jgi:ribosome biogenesis GTPase